MSPELEDATILVTGASSGIGRELARQLADRAGRLVLVARRADRLEALAAELREANRDLAVDVHPCDLGDRAATERLLGELPEIDVLINNAGMGDIGVFDRASPDKLEQMLAINVLAPTRLARALLPRMMARRRGGILNLSSGFGLEWLPGFGAYAASKHYLTALSEVMRLEVADAGVVVTQVCPGPVRTEFEEVAGNFTGVAAPGWLEISAAACARAALRGFTTGRALVVPGIVTKLLLGLGAITPRFVKRLVYRLGARWMRRRQEKAVRAAAA